MIVTIHQPEFLPFGGFFAKAMRSDRFVLLDTVQFKKNYFENRNRVLVNGQPQYVTVPILHKGRLESIFTDVRICEDPRWAKKIIDTLRINYGKYPRAQQVLPPLFEVLATPATHLAPLNIALIRQLADPLGIETEWIVASDLPIRGVHSPLLADLVKALDGDIYLSGAAGREYLDHSLFQDAGIAVQYHEFHAQPYPQPKQETFCANLSVVDLLCMCEPEEARANLLAGSHVLED